jgi:lysophospholipase L1-like esterase
MPFGLRIPLVIALVSLAMGSNQGSSPVAAAHSSVAGRALRYVAIGASDAVGVGTARPEVDGWVPKFMNTLPSGTTLLNLGVSGTITNHAVRHQLPRALEFKPDIATVWLAINDINARVPIDSYKRDLDTIVRSLRGCGAQVLLGNVPDLTRRRVSHSVGYDLVRRDVAKFNEAIADVARRNGAILVDVHSKWHELAAHPEYVGLDGFHPSASGYSRLAQVFQDAHVSHAG